MTSDLPIIDFGVVDELRESVGGDKAFVADLASTYLSEGDDHVQQIADALARGDIAGMVRPAEPPSQAISCSPAARKPSTSVASERPATSNTWSLIS